MRSAGRRRARPVIPYFVLFVFSSATPPGPPPGRVVLAFVLSFRYSPESIEHPNNVSAAQNLLRTDPCDHDVPRAPNSHSCVTDHGSPSPF